MAISSSSLFQRRQARIRSIEALVSIIKDEPDAIALQEAADEIGKLPGAGVPGDVICVYAELLEGLSKGVQWGPAVRAAEVDADRYLVAARKIAADALASARSVPKNIIIAASMLAEMKDEGKIKECAKSLLAVPLPSRLTGVTIPKIVPTMPAPVRPSPSIQPRVLVLLSLDGNLIQSPLALKLNTRHEVLVRTTVKAWPDDAVRLNIDFIGTALPSEVSIHSCEMTQDLQEAPSSIILRVDLADPTTPLHFLTRAEFEFSDGSTVEAEVLGHSRFEITSTLTRNFGDVSSIT